MNNKKKQRLEQIKIDKKQNNNYFSFTGIN